MGEAQGGFRGTENFVYLDLGYGFMCVCMCVCVCAVTNLYTDELCNSLHVRTMGNSQLASGLKESGLKE